MSNMNPGALSVLLKIVFFVPIAAYQLLKGSGEWLQKKIRRANGWERSLTVALVGLPISLVTGWQLADTLAFRWGLGSMSWFALFASSSVLVWSHVWSSIYYFALRYIWDFISFLLRQWGRFCREVLNPALREATNYFRRAPGAERLWSAVEQNGTRSPGVRVLEALLAIAAVTVFLFAGYIAYDAVMVATSLYLSSHTIQLVLAIAAFVTVSGTLSFMAAELFDSRTANIVVYWSIVTGAALAWATNSIFSVPVAYLVALGLAGFLFGVTYGIPGLVAILQSGKLIELVRQWYGLIESVYHEEADKDFAKAYVHGVNALLTPVFGYVAYSVIVYGGMPVWSAVLLSIFTMIYVYSEGPKKVSRYTHVVGEDHLTSQEVYDNARVSGSVIFLIAYATFSLVSTSSTIMAVGAGLAALAVSFALVYPMFYLVLKATFSSVSKPYGENLETLHSRLSGRVHQLFVSMREKQKAAWDDRGDFSAFFGQILNLALVIGTLFNASDLASALIGNSIVSTVIMWFLALNGYVLLGRIFTSYAGITFSAVLSLTSASSVGYLAWSTSGSVFTTVLAALLVCVVIGYALAPMLYLGVRKVISPVVSPQLSRFVVGVFETVWRLYTEVWTMVGTVVRPVVETVRALSASISSLFSR